MLESNWTSSLLCVAEGMAGGGSAKPCCVMMLRGAPRAFWQPLTARGRQVAGSGEDMQAREMGDIN